MSRNQLPHDLDAEASVLGGILLRNETLGLLPTLEVDDFYDPRNKAVFAAMRNLEATARPIDPVMVWAELERVGKLEAIGEGYVGVLSLNVPTPENVEHYAAIVHEHRVSRDVALGCADLLARVYEGGLRGNEAVSAAAAMVSKLDARTAELGRPMGVLVRDEFAAMERDLQAKAEGKAVHVGMPTSLAKLDAHLGGIPVGIVTVLAGRPGCGKTTLAQTFVRAAATLTRDTPVLYSYEDGDQSYAQREIAATAGVATEAIRARELNRDQFSRIKSRAPKLLSLPYVLVQAHGRGVDAIVRDVRQRRLRARSEGKAACGLVVIDYLQNMPLPNDRRNTSERVGDVVGALATLAANEKIAVVLCSQLNRGLESREDKRPRLSDLRDSGRIEELCKVMLGVYRPAKYEKGADPSRLELLVLKNSQGAADCSIDLHWDLATHTIVDSPTDLAGR